jgi:hypothetical protein
MVQRYRPEPDIQLPTPLLVTESKNEFDELHGAFIDAVKPQDMIERMYTECIAYLTWENRRMHRYRAATINAGIRNALQSVLMRLLPEDQEFGQKVARANELVRGWSSDQASRNRVLELLNQNHQDVSAIEAQGIRDSFEDLERIARLLATQESRATTRRQRSLRALSDYMNSL